MQEEVQCCNRLIFSEEEVQIFLYFRSVIDCLLFYDFIYTPQFVIGLCSLYLFLFACFNIPNIVSTYPRLQFRLRLTYCVFYRIVLVMIWFIIPGTLNPIGMTLVNHSFCVFPIFHFSLSLTTQCHFPYDFTTHSDFLVYNEKLGRTDVDLKLSERFRRNLLFSISMPRSTLTFFYSGIFYVFVFYR